MNNKILHLDLLHVSMINSFSFSPQVSAGRAVVQFVRL